MNREVDDYIGRSEKWSAEITALRPLLLGADLTEELKWAKPCYCHDGANIAIVQEMKDFLALMFFKGALVDDPDRLLEDQGPNSRSAKRVCFRSVDDVVDRAPSLTALVKAAIAVEEAGLEIEPETELVLVDELAHRLQADRELRAGFDSLTPGRQREYNLHIGGAKQARTRESRIDKVAERIRSGQGLRDR